MLNRRAFIVRSVAASGALLFMRFDALGIPRTVEADALSDLPDPSWVARHNLTSAEYQAEFDNQIAQGYRLIDVCGYELNGQVRYAAIWEDSDGPAWEARHGLSASEHQAQFDSAVSRGFRPVRVNGYSVGNSAQFASIWEQTDGPALDVRHGLSASDYQTTFDQLVSQGYHPIDVSGYNDGGTPRFAAIFEQSPTNGVIARHQINGDQYQQQFEQAGAQGYRLARVSGYEVNGESRFAAIWEKPIIAPYAGRHRVQESDYQQVFTDLRLQGYRPVQVSGYEVGGRTEFAGVYENRVFDGAEIDGLSGVVNTFMKNHDVPGLSLAIAQQGRLVYAAGFGVADKGTGEPVTTGSRFRIASVTKPITSVSIMKLIEQGKLNLSDTVFGKSGRLGTNYGTTPYGTNIERITIQNLLEHTAGKNWTNDGNDPMFTNPMFDQKQLISWVLDNRSLGTTPGDEYHYSNFGYCVLGRVIEDATGQSYSSWVQQNVLSPSGVGDMQIAGNKLADRAADEVVYYCAAEDPYTMQVTRMDSHGGWIATAVDLARFAVRVDGFSSKSDILSASSISTMTAPSAKNSGYAKGWSVNTDGNWWHIGNLPGNTSVIVRTKSGFCWAALINTWKRDSGIENDLDGMMWDIQKKVTSWPGYDLF